jgi:hypothetical protein
MIASTTDGMILGLEEVLLGSPEDELLHRAFAEMLLRHVEPAQVARGRFIEAQLAREQAGRSVEDRRKLEAKERKLFRTHGRFWLGSLSPFLVEGLNLENPRDTYRHEFQRGWLSRIVAPVLDPQFVAALARAPEARLLRELVFESAGPGGAEALAPLLEASFLPRLRTFWLAPDAGERGRAVVEALVARMPAVTELRTPWHGFHPAALA